MPENITRKKVESIRESLSVTSARKLKRDENYDVNDKRAAYDEKGKQEIAQYTYAHGTATAFWKFKPKFPNSTVRPWFKKYKKNLKEKAKRGQITRKFTETCKRVLTKDHVTNLKESHP